MKTDAMTYLQYLQRYFPCVRGKLWAMHLSAMRTRKKTGKKSTDGFKFVTKIAEHS